jgi:hypothetical protein
MSTRLRCLVARPLALAILAIFANAAPLAGAEIHVAGAAGAVQLEVNDATVDEALTALGALGLRYRTAVALDRRITGTYKGPLARIVSRLLQEYNFVVQTSSDGVQATVLGGQATVLDNSSATAVPSRAIPRVGRPAPAAVQQNQGGQRRIDMTQPPQDKPPTVLDNSSATAVPGLPIPGVGRPAPASSR